MSLNGIDISSYQTGIDLTKVPCDFVIIKVTQGVSYVNPDWKRAYEQAKAAGKLLGLYHYASGIGAIDEADFFLKKIGDKIGKAILVIDWESYQNSKFGKQDVDYVKVFCDRIYQKTGIRPLVYMSKSVCRAHDWTRVAKYYGLWVAQYANRNRTGYKSNPWTDTKGFGAWSSPAIFQYSSSGRLEGYSGNLDLNIAYMDKTAWNKYATGEKIIEELTSKTTLELVKETMQGLHGTDNARKNSLGSRYNEVQEFINHIYESSISTLAKEVIAGKYGSGNTRKIVLGSRYNEVQKKVNEMLK